jgi:hypothetical protein
MPSNVKSPRLYHIETKLLTLLAGRYRGSLPLAERVQSPDWATSLCVNRQGVPDLG